MRDAMGRRAPDPRGVPDAGHLAVGPIERLIRVAVKVDGASAYDAPMHKGAARYIVEQLEPFSQDRRLAILDVLADKEKTSSLHWDQEKQVVRDVTFWKGDEPGFWDMEDDTIAEVTELVAMGSVGCCDNCGKFSALRSLESSSGETDQCRWGCDD